MPSTLDLCEKYYGTRDVYELLGLTKDSLEKDIKKAYYKLSLQVHPDRVPEEEKIEATEKFKVLAKIHSILTDKDKKALFDQQGIIDDDEDESNLSSWLELWKQFFKPITTQDIDNYQKEYKGSDLEKNDIKKAYNNGKGCINFMMNSVPFMSVEDEPRIQEIVKEWIASNEVPEYKQFTDEPKAKRSRRHKKYAKESLEAREIKKKLEEKSNESLEQQIMKRQSDRASNMGNFFDKLMEKYGHVDDTEEFDIATLGKKKKSKKPAAKKQPAKKSNGEANNKEPLNRVKSGRVTRNSPA